MAYTKLIYHIVFSTKERRPLLTAEARSEICEYMSGIIRNAGGRMLAADGTADHIHIATVGSPTIAVSKLVQLVKGNASKWIHETFPGLRDLYWQEGYGAFSVSPSALPRLLAYIHGQEQHHAQVDFKQEFTALLERHGVEYDERYIWR